MSGRGSVAVVVPAYNECALIQRTLASIPPWVQHIVVVDDGSTDGTHHAVDRFNDERVRLVRHKTNLGPGAAVVSGYRAAFALDATVAAVMAGDAQMDPNDLGRLTKPAIDGRAGYVKGDRLSWPGAHRLMPFARYCGNHVLSLLTRVSTRLLIRDSQCGYTAITRTAFEAIDCDGIWTGYGYPNDILARLALAGVSVGEVPVRPVYADERSGIGLRHALFVVPFVLARGWLRRARTPKSRRSLALR